jgi:hypothetical protein
MGNAKNLTIALCRPGTAEGASVLIRVSTIAAGATAAGAAQVFQHFRIEHGRTDFVHAHRPFAKIDFAATVGAERVVLVFEMDKRATGGATMEFGG